MKILLFTALTVCLVGLAVCCPPQPTEAPATASPPCPDGSAPVNCAVDPCTTTTCAAQPGATCKANYCGGCNAVFYDDSGNEVNCFEAK
ncbi:Hypp2729 [Branchiostoma lanceolatum]|uniref:Hypp2729 protein n=1 Tax=Branchiostoma lanceolatum TaxID=7740 RepID=A0A8J9ZTY9_BRALA|nr:Hypp2729 [Branchiostoma lanceolatum]CAH1263556.1 Hypp2729 [Branchiostoma lanceolatum]